MVPVGFLDTSAASWCNHGLVVLRAEHLHEQLPQNVWGSLSPTRFTPSHDGTASLGEWISHGPNEGDPVASD
ncbi:hypothetical protein GCM10010274_30320 [Streptomyces lavendofoliae]|uniref:Uncharacterized protein n=1 Tax=Streptomyces lavendofoliae TaxID=67314 RepID=A0A918HXB8_9ACTN|nr:hypothetical protein GCM10010274_30320 [Streptomyces lavendofoliae]